MPEGLVRSFEVRLVVPGCHPGAEHYDAFLALHDDISEALPYLNAELEQPTDYRHGDRILLWQCDDRAYVFRPHEIAISPVHDPEDAHDVARAIIERINDIWRRRDSLCPNLAGKRPLPQVLDLYQLLPRLNCKKCGLPTCMAFAAALRTDLTKAHLCPHLSQEDLDRMVPR
ncbi:MAG TPA: (Fe-S)-binding protein [Anaerolineae bacterium]|nr:(Fe-S)-binding protein [Anaerolineae bacterium]HOR01173.1 (Fe-S)-binding protein [Anaerolineae bacterium]HPL27371.1 (Fe-S)-binding protein [Anaerolineae bacterium]